MESRLPRFLRGMTTFALGLLITVSVLIVVLVGFLFLSDATEGPDLPVPIQFTIDTDRYSLESADWGEGTLARVTGEAQFAEPSIGLAVGAGAAIAAGIGAAFLVLILLRRIFTTMRDGTPFLPENVRRIRWLGYIVIAAAVVEQLVTVMLGVVMIDNVTSAGIELNYAFNLNFTAIFLGLIILAIAEVFRYGTNLQSDADLTV